MYQAKLPQDPPSEHDGKATLRSRIAETFAHAAVANRDWYHDS